MQDLVKNREEASTLFYKSYFELEEKKDKQLQVADFGGKSVIDLDKANLPKDELLRNRTIAKYLMFPEVSEVNLRKTRNFKKSSNSSPTSTTSCRSR